MQKPIANYDQFIDSETWGFIKETDKWYPPEIVSFSIQRQREIYNAMCREFHQGYPSGVTAKNDIVINQGQSVSVRRYFKEKVGGESPLACVVYFHGGGFVVGGLESHDDVCSEICDRTGFKVVSVDYRLSPEHQHPAAFDDSMTVVSDQLAKQNLPIVLCGDSAGGNLAAAVAHSQRGRSTGIVGQVLIYPGLGGDTETGSYITHANAPMLTTRDVKFYSDIRTDFKPAVEKDATLAPLHDTSFSDLPPTIVFSAECDPLADDGTKYCSQIAQDGGMAFCFNEKGMVHGYLRARVTVRRAADSFSRIVESLSMLGHRDWRY